jgi:putative MATE family efflux protein
VNEPSAPVEPATPSSAPHAPPPPASAWATIREAIRGSEQDFTRVPLRRAVVLLAVPMVLEMSMESLFAVVDMLWVSRLGSDAVAAVVLTEGMLALIYAVAFGLAAGATALVARRIGEKDADGAARAAGQSLIAAVVVAAVMGVAGTALAPRLLAAMGATPAVVARGTGYTTVMFGGNVTIVMLFVVNAIFRGAGDAAMAMRSLWLANILNIVLGPCFIFGLGPFPRLGVTGAAVATTIGRGIGVIYQLVTLARGDGRIRVGSRDLALDPPTMRSLLGVAGTGTLQTLVETASWLGLVRILSTFGSLALAGYGVAMRISIFALLPAFGLANAAATLVGQNLGAGEPERAERAVGVAARYNIAFLGIVGVAFVALPSVMLLPFQTEPGALPYAIECLRIVALGFLFYAYGMVVVTAFNGAGDTVTPTLINLGCFWAFKIPMAYLLALPLGLGPRGVFIAITVAYSVQAVVSGLLFRRGRWKLKKV